MAVGAVVAPPPLGEVGLLDKPLGEVIRNALGAVPDQGRIQVIVQMRDNSSSDGEDGGPENS